MADPVNETELGIVPVEETTKIDTPQPLPINAWASELEPEEYTTQQHWFKRGTRVVLPAMLSAILGAAAAVTVMHFTAPKRVAATSVAITSVQSPDDQFITALVAKGITAGVEGLRQRYMEMGHHTCFNLAPPDTQPMTLIEESIMATENADVRNNPGPFRPTFTISDAEVVAKSGVAVYCPQFSNLAR